MGGAAGINLLFGIMRVKFAAVLIGTAGVGLLASFSSIQGLIGTLAGLGIQSSAVREVAAAVSKGDQQVIGRVVLTLRRICWLTGLLGLAAMMLLSPLISQFTFGNDDYRLDVTALGVIILFSNLSGGQLALLQGMRRIGDMARANVIGAALATATAIGFYTWLGVRGIVPALIVTAAINLALSWHFARRVPVPPMQLGWRQTFDEAGGMVKLGLVFMWNGLLGNAVTFVTIMLITQQEGVQAVGLYSAAYTLSGMFVNFVLGAMGADYYPRLTGIAPDKAAMNRMVNEQTEIGLLLAVPGLVATMVLTPWILQIFYTQEFLGAIELLQWLTLGCMGRVISWPMSYILLAMGSTKWFLLIEISFQFFEVALVAIFLHYFGLQGVAFGFFLKYVVYIFTIYLVSFHLIGFSWTLRCKNLLLIATPILAASFIAGRNLSLWPACFVGLVLTLLTTIFCLGALTSRLGNEHWLTRTLVKIPFFKSIKDILSF